MRIELTNRKAAYLLFSLLLGVFPASWGEETAESYMAKAQEAFDRLGIDPDIRDAWCESHAGEVIEMEFRGAWSKSIAARSQKRYSGPANTAISSASPSRM